MQQTINGNTTTYSLGIAAGPTQVLADGENAYFYGNGRIAQHSANAAAYFLVDALSSRNDPAEFAARRAGTPCGWPNRDGGVERAAGIRQLPRWFLLPVGCL